MIAIVPFNPGWLDSSSLDLLAVYRRPQTHPITKERVTDADGRQAWDYANLPMRRHNDWTKKGYEYVTLARVDDVVKVRAATPEVLAGYKRTGDPEERMFLMQEFLKHATVVDDAKHADLIALVHEFGSEATERIRRGADPTFELPEKLRGIAPGTPRSDGPSADAGVPPAVSPALTRGRKKESVTA